MSLKVGALDTLSPPPAEPLAASSSPSLVLVAGESSGDALGAGLIHALRERAPALSFGGIGGAKMAAAGMDCWFDAEELAIMGLTEVLRHLPRLVRIRRAVARRAVEEGAAGFVGIDAPDFNLGLERQLRRAGLRTVHYVCPSIWAWRRRRAASIGRSADRVLTLFPFELEILAQHGVDARFVGHPLADRLDLEPDRQGARRALGLGRGGPVVAVLPGSRRSEITRIGPDLAATVSLLAAARPELEFVTPAATETTGALFRAQLDARAPGVPVTMVAGQAGRVLTAADAAIVASGTATLEALLARTPMVVVYRIARSTHFLVTALGLMRVNRYSLPNALAGEEVVREFMQHDLEPERVAGAVLELLEDDEQRSRIDRRFQEIHRSLRREASARAAEAVLQVIS